MSKLISTYYVVLNASGDVMSRSIVYRPEDVQKVLDYCSQRVEEERSAGRVSEIHVEETFRRPIKPIPLQPC